MTTLIKRSGIRYVNPWDLVDQTLQNVFDGWERQHDGTTATMDFYREGDTYVAEIELPGYKPGDVNLRLYRDHFEVTARREECQSDGGRQHLVKERCITHCSRTVHFPEAINPDKAEASFEGGILRIKAPIASSSPARTFDLTGDATPQLDESFHQEDHKEN